MTCPFLNIQPTMFLPLARSWISSQPCFFARFPVHDILPTISLPLLKNPPIFLRLARSWISCRPCSNNPLFPEYPANPVPNTRPFLNILPTIYYHSHVPVSRSDQPFSYVMRVPEYPADHVSTTPPVSCRPCSDHSPVPEYPADHFPTIRLFRGTGQLCSYDWPVPEYPNDHVPTIRLFLRNRPAMFLRLTCSWISCSGCGTSPWSPRGAAWLSSSTRPPSCSSDQTKLKLQHAL